MADQTNISISDSEKVTPEPKRFCKYTSDSESDDHHLQNNIVMEEVLSHHDGQQSVTDSVVQSTTSPSTSHRLPSQPPIIFTTTEGQSVNLSEVIKHTIVSPDFVDCIGPLIANVFKVGVDSALSNYVSNLEAKIEKQEQIISDLMVKNSELKRKQ
ncbi:unnamed protein product [Mytilus coruscus]|uniref:Uncharacterized protein n=1 Tax=Mytilus coruscus TaxID=42192 RepID=A0A6J8ES31_MYTCO|nr:unnamed protein product [Mytilus coruscus]